MRGKLIPAKKIARVMEEYRAGALLSDLAKKYRVGYSTLRRYARMQRANIIGRWQFITTPEERQLIDTKTKRPSPDSSMNITYWLMGHLIWQYRDKIKGGKA